MDFVPPSDWPSHGNVELEDLQVVIPTDIRLPTDS